MMTDFYSEMQSVASDLLAEFDQTDASKPANPASNGVYYKAIVPGSGPADDPGPASPAFYKVNAVAKGVRWKYVQSGLAVAGQLQCTIPVDPRFAPSINGFMVVDGKTFKITQVMASPAAGTPVVYTVIFGDADPKLAHVAHV